MKEIKFRIYSRTEKKFYYWGFNEYGFRGFPTNDIDFTIEYCRKHSQEYIGLEDKNKKEIYRGDICKQIFNRKKNIGEVTFSPTQGYLVGNWPLWPHDIEVIGNLNENPEMSIIGAGIAEK